METNFFTLNEYHLLFGLLDSKIKRMAYDDDNRNAYRLIRKKLLMNEIKTIDNKYFVKNSWQRLNDVPII